jgi:hypothetical protein
MTPEERKAKDAARKREAYARRKKAQAELSNKLPTTEAEERWSTVLTGNLQPLSKEEILDYVDSREKAQAVQAESVARDEYIDLLFSKFERCTNIPQLLQAILRELITLRVTLTDLIGGLRR